MPGPISLVTVCDSALLAQVAMRVVGGAALHHFGQQAGELWYSLVEPAWEVDPSVF